jgi:hypothetical protein
MKPEWGGGDIAFGLEMLSIELFYRALGLLHKAQLCAFAMTLTHAGCHLLTFV